MGAGSVPAAGGSGSCSAHEMDLKEVVLINKLFHSFRVLFSRSGNFRGEGVVGGWAVSYICLFSIVFNRAYGILKNY